MTCMSVQIFECKIFVGIMTLLSIQQEISPNFNIKARISMIQKTFVQGPHIAKLFSQMRM